MQRSWGPECGGKGPLVRVVSALSSAGSSTEEVESSLSVCKAIFAAVSSGRLGSSLKCSFSSGKSISIRNAEKHPFRSARLPQLPSVAPVPALGSSGIPTPQFAVNSPARYNRFYRLCHLCHEYPRLKAWLRRPSLQGCG